MRKHTTNRRGFLAKLAAVCGGLAVVPFGSRPARARSFRRGWGFGGYRSHFRGWGGYGYGRPFGYGGYGFGGGNWYGGAIPGGFNYNSGYFGMPYGGGYYGGGYYNTPFGGGFSFPGGYYGGYSFPPVLKLDKRKMADPLALLEC